MSSPTAPQTSGVTGLRLGQTVRALREKHHWDLRELSRRLGEVGNPISLGQLSKLERGERRVDVDDLVALAVAFNTSPNSLLFPGYPTSADEEEPVDLTPVVSEPWNRVWQWAVGAWFLPRLPVPGPDEEIDWYETNRPHDPTGSYDFNPETFRGHEGALRDVLTAVRQTVRAARNLDIDRQTIMRAINWWTAMDAELTTTEVTRG
jgi:transcriptional regulator with XRE-family HTH domain